ncbi:MAG: polyprenol monophosphomannose synthase [Candidatus Eisenbacteria bacterium]|uniref:Polyprenol monophosphomannose synthase n=1 Tax=Eiseniibacteriota bacterium TaxID=2212470 RepID=A0A538SCT9_UNCEI|nr:MAG: polyprenol monophosphomannose synthase [Candidatus Eisenbacteria bacterium]TMQ57565.1 MAG: polyprenol monophosphomannose synthase [Candidatus Eisenbacteria bacterium]
MKALVIIPTYNERENLPELLRRIFAEALPLEVLIIDDNSPDGTGAVADQLAASNPCVHVMHRPAKMGLGSAYVAGFRYALERQYTAVFEMDADFSHNPDSLPQFLRELETADLVVGSRYLHGVTVVNWPLKRLILSYGANVYSRVITGIPIKDLTGGFKCFRREVLEALDLSRVRSDGYGFQIEINYKAWRKGFRIREIPILFVDRRAGESKMSRRIVLEAAWMVWRLRILDLLGAL